MRATSDVDLLVRSENAQEIARLFVRRGYRSIHASDDAGNFVRGDERLDVLFASRPVARGPLESAAAHPTAFGELRVVSAEGLIGFKLQALVNDPRRTRDQGDIRDLLRANLSTLNLAEVRDYFRLFDLMTVVEALCPTWPDRPLPRVTVGYLL